MPPAQPLPEFYKSCTITLVVSVPPGGGYDILSRVVARHIGRHIPGAPNVVVQNVGGAGGVVATNYLASRRRSGGAPLRETRHLQPHRVDVGSRLTLYPTHGS